MSKLQLSLMALQGSIGPLLVFIVMYRPTNPPSGEGAGLWILGMTMTVSSIGFLLRDIYRLRALLDAKTEKAEQPANVSTR